MARPLTSIRAELKADREIFRRALRDRRQLRQSDQSLTIPELIRKLSVVNQRLTCDTRIYGTRHASAHGIRSISV